MRAAMRVCTPITIRYGETDMMGVVYHANYLLYFEDARTAFLEAVGYPYERIEQAGFMSPVTHMECDYGEPLRYGDTAVVRTRVVSARPTKTVYAYEVFREGQDLDHDKPLATGRSTHCLVDAATFKPVSMKKTVPELYERYQEIVEPDGEGDVR
ncbi:acyl-CoA thioesterase [Gordonibacter massiliensis (ex Traore et al. 2017)]